MTKDGTIELYNGDAEVFPTSASLNGQIITEQDALAAIDNVLNNLYETSDLAPIDATLNSLLGLQNISGKSLAKLLWGIKKWWDESNQSAITGDTFEDRMYTTHRLKRTVMDRYISLWDKYERGLIPESIQNRNLKDQIAISKTVENYEISDKNWQRLEHATTNNEVLEILREVKNKPAKKSSLQLREERDGNVYGWRNGERKLVAWFNIEEEDDPIVRDSLRRLRGEHVIRR